MALQFSFLDKNQFSQVHETFLEAFSAVRRIADDVIIYSALSEEGCVGLLVYCPFLNWIMSLIVKRDCRRKGIATQLLAHFLKYLPPETKKVKLLNVDHCDTKMGKFLDMAGFQLYVQQFEMELTL